MDDLISRQDAIDAIKKYFNGLPIEVHYDMIAMIYRLPTAQAERKKGEWIDGMEYVNSHWKICSICHKSAHDSSGGDNFCPNCGADMRDDFSEHMNKPEEE